MNLEYYKQIRINFLKKFKIDYYIYLNKNNLLNKDLNNHSKEALAMYYSLLKTSNNSNLANKLVIKQIICQK